MIKLKPCPKCGGEPVIYEPSTIKDDGDWLVYWWGIGCKNRKCGHWLSHSNLEYLVERWNTGAGQQR